MLFSDWHKSLETKGSPTRSKDSQRIIYVSTGYTEYEVYDGIFSV